MLHHRHFQSISQTIYWRWLLLGLVHHSNLLCHYWSQESVSRCVELTDRNQDRPMHQKRDQTWLEPRRSEVVTHNRPRHQPNSNSVTLNQFFSSIQNGCLRFRDHLRCIYWGIPTGYVLCPNIYGRLYCIVSVKVWIIR